MFCVWFFKAIWKQIIIGVNLSFEEEEEEEEEEEKSVVLMPWEGMLLLTQSCGGKLKYFCRYCGTIGSHGFGRIFGYWVKLP